MPIERYRGGLTPWDPFREIEEFRQRMMEWFRPLFPVERRWEVDFWTPAIEMVEEKDKYVVKADLPGMKKEDIEVSVTQNMFTIKGERKIEEQRKDKGYYYCERRYGSFVRSIALPGSVEVDKIKATYKDGVLTVELPKAEEEKGRKIDIQVE
ncbi:MAG TPA: Hsp20/alpha crystallin family protein [Moorella mulderi]|nr:Hsp20/alpha crystallin family protein [Moorella mulderi]